MEKLVSVITVTYNAENFIVATLNSIFAQSEQNFEFILIDGSSSDNTLQIINDHDIKPDILISERDSGIYDAMMKGVLLASGRYVVFLNAGDVFYDSETLKAITKQIKSFDSNPTVIFGDCIVKSLFSEKYLAAKSIQNIWAGIPMCHQSIYVLRESFFTYPLSRDFKYASDYKQMLDMFVGKESFFYTSNPHSVVVANGASDRNRYKVIYENYKIIKKHSIFKSCFYLIRLLPILLLKSMIKLVVPHRLLMFLVK